jgi:serine-type D-Ala-D-Ala carboxypeptidase (penicillin-binding protein 5/6)
MENVRRVAAISTVSLLLSALLAPPGVALPGSTPIRAPAVEPVGGPQLAGRGVVVNPAPGVRGLPKVKAGAYLIADADSGQVLAAKDPHGHYLPASALKMLTAVALIPKLDPKAKVRPTQATCDVEGTKVGMTPKLEYKVSDLFHALLMVSGNDAALALAQAGGGLKPTIAAMNAEARRLRAGDTVAGSPNGLDKDLGLSVQTQHTSVYDLALIMRQGLKLPALRAYTGKNHHWWPAPPTKAQRKKGKKTGGYPIYSHIRLLPGQRHAYPGAIGGKNGFTIAAKQTFVGAAKRDGKTIIVALLRGDNLWTDTTKLLDWGFAAGGKVRPIGVLVPPVGTEKPPPPRRDTTVLPPNPLTDDDSARGWSLLAVGGAGAVVAAGGAFLMLRRRRRPVPAYRSPVQDADE